VLAKVLIISSILIGYKFIYKRKLFKPQNGSSKNSSHSNDDDKENANAKNNKLANNSHLFRLKVIRHVSVDFRNFKLEDCIGQGNYGTVYKCSLPPSFEKKYAVKHIECVDVCLICCIYLFIFSQLDHFSLIERNCLLKKRDKSSSKTKPQTCSQILRRTYQR
jgi:hypothetical protein